MTDRGKSSIVNRQSSIAVVGLGRMGQIHLAHLKELRDRLKLVAACDCRLSLLEQASDYGVATYADFTTMVERERPEAVIIATPPASHASLITAAAAHGIHIFCEKPLALTRQEAHSVARAVTECGVVLQIGFQRRFDRAYRDAQNKIRDGVIGDPITFKAVARDAWEPNLEYARPEVSGGLLLDMAIHDFDLARWLMGSEVSRVSTEGNNLLYPQLSTVGDIDNAVVNLTFASGAIGNIEASRTGTYGYDIRTEIVGTRGALYIGPIADDAILVAGRNGFERRAISGFEERFLDSYRQEIKAFVDCFTEGRPAECGLDDAVAALEIALAAAESLRTKLPVEIPLITDH